MHVLIVSQYAVPPTSTGITRHHALATALVRRGHRATIVASSFQHWTRQETLGPAEGDIRVEMIDGVRFVWLRTPQYSANGAARVWNMLAFMRRLGRRELRARLGAFDIVIGSSPPLFAAWGGSRLARRAGVPFVLEVRDLWPASLIDLGRVSRRHPAVVALGVLERHLYRRASQIVSALPSAAPAILARRGCPGDVTWVPNGVDLALIGAPAPVAELGHRPFTVMYAGAHNLANTLDTVLDAAALLERASGPETYRFVFIGDGPERSRLIERARALSLTSVHFEPAVPKREVYARLRDADAFVLTLRDIGLYDHGISVNKLYDYLALARPVVVGLAASNNPVAEADAGITVRPEDPAALAEGIRELSLRSADDRRAMGLRGRRFIEQHHTSDTLAVALEAVLVAAFRGQGRH